MPNSLQPQTDPPPPIDVITLFPELLANLLILLGDLTTQQWAEPTACPDWTVKDIAMHLLGVDIGNLSVKRDGFRDPWWAASGDDLVAALTEWNGIWVAASQRISPRLLCQLLEYTGQLAADYFASLDLEQMGNPVSWAGPRPAPVWLDVAREYTERWVHQQQIRDAINLPGCTEPRYLAPVIATFAHALPHALRVLPATAGTTVRLHVTGPSGGSWLAGSSDGVWMLSQDNGMPAATTVTIEDATAWRLWTRGYSREEAASLVHTEGNPAFGTAVLQMVSIIA